MGALCSRAADVLAPDATNTTTTDTSNNPHPLTNLRLGSSNTTKTAPRRESEKRGMR